MELLDGEELVSRFCGGTLLVAVLGADSTDSEVLEVLAWLVKYKLTPSS